MKIISEFTNKEYPTVEECLKDEEFYKAKEEEKRKAEKLRLEEKDAHKVHLNELRTAADDAINNYQKALTEYSKKYGEFYDRAFAPFASFLFDW